MQKELEDLLDILGDIGRVVDNFDDPDRGLILRLRKQVGNLSREERFTLRDAARLRHEAYLGWLEVGVAKD